MTETFGPYELQDLLGRGGMGEVYRAVDTVKGRTVALKVLRQNLAADETFQARFRRESRIVARLHEPHIIPIHDFGEIDGRLYLDMRLVEGADLASVLATRGRLPAAVAVDLIAQIASALDAAHADGLVHRDVKPSNVIVTRMDDLDADHFAYLVDFGIARGLPGHGTALTSTTATIGTMAYTAPERISGAAPGDARSDIYSLACVLHECLTGAKPFDGEMFAIMYAHVHDTAAAVSSLAVDAPPGLDDVVGTGMAKDPARRYASAGQLARAARAAVAGTAPAAAPVDRPAVELRKAQGPASERTPRADDRPTRDDTRPRDDTDASRVRILREETVARERAVLAASLVETGTGDHHRPQRRRTFWIAVVAAVVVLAAVVGVGLVVSGHRRSSAAGQASGSTTPQLGTWRLFGGFSRLIGERAGDTAGAYLNATCTLVAPDPSVPGLAYQVRCQPASGVDYTVYRFATSVGAGAFVDGLKSADHYTSQAWLQLNLPRGMNYQPPPTVHARDIVSSICALPIYLVRFSAPASISQSALVDTYWRGSIFPNVTPAAC